MHKLNYLLIIILLFAGCTTNKSGKKYYKDVAPPIEETNFKQLTSHEDIIKYLEKVDSHSNKLTLEYIGNSVEGKKIPLVKFSKAGKVEENKLKLLMFAQQHGNEPSGKEGMLLLINDLLQNKYDNWLDKVDLLLIPQLNPDGGDKNQRRNANNADLNRDHLILEEPETQAIHKVFKNYQPEITVDIHEYYPFSQSWKEFGYLKNFDIQIGGLTNINIEPQIIDIFYDNVKPYMQEQLKKEGYSFFEYTLGNLSDGGRLRHSTVSINDGRQSFGILNTSSYIVEGRRGRDSLDNLEHRARSQHLTAKGFIELAAQNAEKIKNTVARGREKLIKNNGEEKISIQMKHVKGDKPLQYPLKSVKTGEDTVFVVDEYHSERKSQLNVTKPSAYLIPASDSNLVKWLDRSFIQYTEYMPSKNHAIYKYKILTNINNADKDLKNYNVEVELQKCTKKITKGDYLMVPTAQLRSNKITIALEPQSMSGLVNYDSYEYLIKDNNTYPILRLEKR
ncbi:MAG: M14 family zinc carboxypeptidase [Bacteroidales bacterium]